MEGSKIELLHYKNAVFHGHIASLRKNGEALIAFDGGSLLVGKFANDQLNEECVVILEPDTYFIGSFKKGALDGPFCVRSPRFSVYSQAHMNKVVGEVLVIDKKTRVGRVWEIEHDEGVCIRQGEYDFHFSEEKIVKALAPYTKTFPTILEYFLLNLSNKFSIKVLKAKDRLEIALEAKAMRKLAIHLEKERLAAYGVMVEGVITGLGYIYDRPQEVQYEGEIEKGQLHGEGIKRELLTGRCIFGKFSRGDIRSLDVLAESKESADASLGRLKKKIHNHSLEYINDYINERPIFLLKNFMREIVQNELKYSQFQAQQPVLPSQKSQVLSREVSSDQLKNNIYEYNMISQALRAKK